ncbi:MAG: dihydroneopterin aldolase [Thiotrichales bacterium]|nr:dihydroneopterin aldolase [Thiotrichales bacterium]NOX27877.1 dihydroneopterin aldolase [Gammaproteobacteria bacterium]
MDIIYLSELKIETVIGIWDWERKIKQEVVINLEMGADIARAAESDQIDDTLNYKAVAKRLIQYVGDSEFQLVETLAERIAGIIRDEFDVPWVKVKINKRGAIRGARDVGVLIERGTKI